MLSRNKLANIISNLIGDKFDTTQYPNGDILVNGVLLKYSKYDNIKNYKDVINKDVQQAIKKVQNEQVKKDQSSRTPSIDKS